MTSREGSTLGLYWRGLRFALLALGVMALSGQASAADTPRKDPPTKPAPSGSAKPFDPKEADAKPEYDLVVWVLHADNSKHGIDKSLEKFRHLLQKPPLSAYKSYKLIERLRLPLLFERKSLKVQTRFNFALQRIEGRAQDRVHYRYWLGREGDKKMTQVTNRVKTDYPSMILGPTWDHKTKDSGQIALLLRVRPHKAVPLPKQPPKK